MTIGKYIQKGRQDAGISQLDLAKKLGYSSPQFISNWERGISLPPVSTMAVVCKACNLNRKEAEEIYMETVLTKTRADLMARFEAVNK